jgi:Uma2 family endonuclease
MSIAADDVRVRLFSAEEYNLLGEQGFFHPDEKLELIEGIIYKKARQSPGHAYTCSLLHQRLTHLVGEVHHVRPGLPLALGPYSEPEPDIAVVPGGIRDYVLAHPSFAVLVIEVADASLLHDRAKARLYARTGIPEYWILNLVKGCLEVYRAPQADGYTSRAVLGAGDSVSPLARPERSIPVSELLR